MSKYFKSVSVSIALLGVAINSFGAIANSASAFLIAEPGNYVGGTLPSSGVTLTHGTNTVFRTSQTSDYSAYIYTSGDHNLSFNFSAADYSAVDNTSTNRPLAIGFYDNARRYPFNSEINPGLNASGDGRGFNTLSGWFNVIAVSYDQSNQVTSLAVDFAEYGENLSKSGPALFGSLRFNSDIPLNTALPEASSVIQMTIGLLMIGFTLRQHRRRFNKV